jgi:DNA-binding beta-propeller fold protein YncE
VNLSASIRSVAVLVSVAVMFQVSCRRQKVAPRRTLNLPSSKLLILPAPGHPQPTNSFPTAAALSADGKYLALLNNGYGTRQSDYQESIAILDVSTGKVADFPDPRLGQHAAQTYFLGLAFSPDGRELYASMASLTDPTGEHEHDTGNGIAVYRFDGGNLTPQSFIKIPLAPLAPGKKSVLGVKNLPRGMTIPYPAGLSVLPDDNGEKFLVAEDLADDAVVVDAEGKVLKRFPLSTDPLVPAAYPYGVVETRDGKTGFCSLWNASKIAKLDLENGKVVRMIPLLVPQSRTAPGSHPTAMLLSPDQSYLYVTLTNSDQVAVVDVETGQVAGLLSTELPEEKYGGTYPDALAQTSDGRKLFVADASADAVAVFDTSHFASQQSSSPVPERPEGFIPTEWYPTALAVKGDSLFIVTGKGVGTGPNELPVLRVGGRIRYRYICTLIHGSVARVSIRNSEAHLAELTQVVERSNLMEARTDQNSLFQGRNNPIRHVIYVIKENRTYDQIFGDLKPGNGDPSLCMFGEDVTPNEHALARQFGIVDNFYCSGEVSGDGHDWSTAAITSDYNEKTWEISYRGRQGTGAFGGVVFESNPLLEGIPDVDDPGTGFIWSDVAQHDLTHRNYGEFIITHWCDKGLTNPSLQAGVPLSSRGACSQKVVRRGKRLPPNVGEPHGSPSPWSWPVPMIAYDQATKPALEGHFDPRYADFRLDYPDQLRMDEFLDEFKGFVHARESGHGTELPQCVIMWLPDDHTAGTRPGMPTPAASVADNDLAVGRLVEAVSHSPYWNDTAIFILEDDAQNGPDHVDAHRSTALVVSKYSPGSVDRPFVDHHFYTTVGMIHTFEELLGLPPMNNNDAGAPVMAPLFSGPGNQPPFTADIRNRQNGLIYRMNSPHAPGARESARMDFSHADRANADELNAILWRDRMGNSPMPKPRHVVFR